MLSGRINQSMQSGNWTQINASDDGFNAQHLITDILFYSNQFGLASSSRGVIMRTVDGGASWSTQPTPLAEGTIITSVEIINPNLCYAGYQLDASAIGLLISTDGGLTWEQETSGQSFIYPSVNDIHFTNSGTFFIAGKPHFNTNGMIMSSNGDFTNWTSEFVTEPIHSLTSLANGSVFAVGDNGYIVSRQEVGVGIKDLLKKPQLKLYPNPASDIISITLPNEEENQLILIYDQNGQMISSSENKINTVNVQDLSSGTYTIQIQTENNLFNTTFIKK
jgi:hypothetical protein